MDGAWEIWRRGCELAVSGSALLLASITLGKMVDGWRVIRAARANGIPLAWRTPAQTPSEIWVCLASLALCLGTLVAFAPSVMVTLPQWALPAWLDGFIVTELFVSLQVMIRAHVALGLLGFFLYLIADNARWKLVWLACWYAFSLGVAFLR